MGTWRQHCLSPSGAKETGRRSPPCTAFCRPDGACNHDPKPPTARAIGIYTSQETCGFIGSSPSPPDAGRRRGPGRGGAFTGLPLSPSLSPLVPRGERGTCVDTNGSRRGLLSAAPPALPAPYAAEDLVRRGQDAGFEFTKAFGLEQGHASTEPLAYRARRPFRVRRFAGMTSHAFAPSITAGPRPA